MKTPLSCSLKRFVPRAVLWVLWCASTTLAQQQPAHVMVHVYEATDEQPIYQADVQFMGFGQMNASYRVFTDGSGTADFPGVVRGNYYLQVDKVGYERYRANVDISPGSGNIFTVPLTQKKDPHASEKPSTTTVPAAMLNVPSSARKEYDTAMEKMKTDPRQSVAHLRKAIDKYPKFAQAYAMLGMVYSQQQQDKEALDALIKAVEINPELSLGQMMLGKYYLEHKQFDDAEKRLQEAVRLDPQAWDAQFELARCYYNKGQFDDALKFALRSRELPQAAPITRLLVVDVYLKKGEQQSALNELEAFVKDNPQSPYTPRAHQLIEKLKK